MKNWIWASAAHFSKRLAKTSVGDIMAFEHRFTDEPNIEFETEHRFLYCFSVWITANEQFWLVSAGLTEKAEYTLKCLLPSNSNFNAVL